MAGGRSNWAIAHVFSNCSEATSIDLEAASDASASFSNLCSMPTTVDAFPGSYTLPDGWGLVGAGVVWPRAACTLRVTRHKRRSVLSGLHYLCKICSSILQYEIL